MKHGNECIRMMSRLKEMMRVNISRDKRKRVEKYGHEIKDLLIINSTKESWTVEKRW